MTVRTLNELFLEAVRRHDKPDAFRVKRDGAWRDVSHREAARTVQEIAAGLAAMGVKPGDRVAILSENRLEWALADYAILAAGAITVPIYATLIASQIEFILADSGSSVVFVSGATRLSVLDALRPHLRADLQIVPFDVGSSEGASAPGPTVGLCALQELGRARRLAEPDSDDRRRDAVAASDLASIIYTSGTTGRPKGVMLTHGNIVSNVQAVRSVMSVGPTDSCLSFLPLCHIFERMAGHFTMLDAGVSIAYAETMESVSANLVEIRPTVVFSVPRLYEKIHARVLDAVHESSPGRQKLFHWAMGVGRRRSECLLMRRAVPWILALQFQIASILVFAKIRARLGDRIRFMVSGGAPLSADIARFFHAAGILILEGYGLTETSPVISVNRLDNIKVGTVGQAIPGVEVSIAPDGEILVRGANVMAGYFNDPEGTAAVMEGGWFHTGDIGRLDPEGFLSITDRKKDLIVTAGGKNVAPQPIEEQLKKDPCILEAVVFGDRHPFCVALLAPDYDQVMRLARESGITESWTTGEVDRAAMSRNPRVVAFLMTHVEQVNRELASFERIRKIALIDRELTVADGDLTPTLKVKRRDLEARYRSLIDALYASHEGR